MIMPCINSTSAGESGGKLGRVDAGNVFVGSPGKPGCTTTAAEPATATVAGPAATIAGPAASTKAVLAAGPAVPAGGRAGRPSLAALLLSVAAGAGIAAQLICLSRSPQDSGIAPLIACRAASVALLLPVVALRRGPAPSRLLLPRPGPAVAAGIFDAAGNLAFLLAVRGGTLVVVAVITALYPAGTVLLARRILAERLTRWQLAGLAAAAAAVTILAVS